MSVREMVGPEGGRMSVREMVAPTWSVEANADGNLVFKFYVPGSKFGAVRVILAPEDADTLCVRLAGLLSVGGYFASPEART